MSLIFIFFTIMIYGTIVAIMCLMPYMNRKNLIFGVIIPADQSGDKEVLRLKTEYVKKNLIGGCLYIALVVVLYFLLGPDISSIIAGLGTFVYLFFVFLIYRRQNIKAKNYKKSKGWDVKARNIQVVDTQLLMEKMLVSPMWFVPHMLTVVATAFIIYRNYDSIGDQIPMKYNIDGLVISYAQKTPMTVAFPIIMQLLMVVIFVFVYFVMAKASIQIDPDNIELSRKQLRVYRREWSRFTLIMAYAMVVLFAYMGITMVGYGSPTSILVVVMAIVIAILAYVLILAVKVGQGGSRIGYNESKGSVINRDDDQYWKAGMFYVNKEDPSFFIEKRVGVGFTINFGRTMAVFIFIMLLVIIALVSIIATGGL